MVHCRLNGLRAVAVLMIDDNIQRLGHAVFSEVLAA